MAYIKERENFGRCGSAKSSSIAKARQELANKRNEEIQSRDHCDRGKGTHTHDYGTGTHAHEQVVHFRRPQRSMGVASWDQEEKELHNWVTKRGHRGKLEYDRSASLPTRNEMKREKAQYDLRAYDGPFRYNVEPPLYGPPHLPYYYHAPPPVHYYPYGDRHDNPHYPRPPHRRHSPSRHHHPYNHSDSRCCYECGHSPPRHSYSPPERGNSPSRREHRHKEAPISNGDGLKAASMASYRAVLNQQIEEKRKREEREMEDKERFIRKIESEAAVYDPWGKPGAGAPLLDTSGNVITERGQMSKSFDQSSPRLTDEDRKKMQQLKHREELEEQVHIYSFV